MKNSTLLSLSEERIALPGASGKVLNVSLELVPGDLCLVRGANGAGKSTFLKWLYKRLQESSTSNSYLAQGADEDFVIPGQLLDVAYYMSSNNRGLAESNALFPKKLWHTPWNKASLGERQRALLAGVLLDAPKLLLLDEPTSALDSEGEKIFWNEIQNLRELGSAVLLVYHGASEGLPEHKELVL